MKTSSSLPKNEKTFSINIVGDTTKQNWTGKFTCVCMPTLKQKSDAAILEAQLNQDMKSLDQNTVLFHRMVAQLSQRLIEAPEWWITSDGGRDLMDVNVVWEVYKGCAEAEEQWKEKVWGKEEKEEKKEIKKSEESDEEAEE